MASFRYRTTAADPRLEVAIPVALYQELVRCARDSGRTLQTELNIRLARTFEITVQDQEENALIASLFSGSNSLDEDCI